MDGGVAEVEVNYTIWDDTGKTKSGSTTVEVEAGQRGTKNLAVEFVPAANASSITIDATATATKYYVDYTSELVTGPATIAAGATTLDVTVSVPSTVYSFKPTLSATNGITSVALEGGTFNNDGNDVVSETTSLELTLTTGEIAKQ